MGLALKGAIKFGTADEQKGLGTGTTGGAVDLILSKNLNYKADLHASVGYRFNSDPDARNIGNAFKWGFGFNLPACEKFSLQAEVIGMSYSDAEFSQTNTVDLIAGPVIWFKPGPLHPARHLLRPQLRPSGQRRQLGQEDWASRSRSAITRGRGAARSTRRLRRPRRRPTGPPPCPSTA